MNKCPKTSGTRASNSQEWVTDTNHGRKELAATLFAKNQHAHASCLDHSLLPSHRLAECFATSATDRRSEFYQHIAQGSGGVLVHF